MVTLYVDTDEVLAAPFYAFGMLLVGLPLLDFVTSVLPVFFVNTQWRYTTVGLFSNFLLTPLLGVGVMIAVAGIREHLVFQRVLATINGIVAVLLIALLVRFVLDIVTLTATIPPDGLKSFQNAAFKAIVKLAMTILVLTWLSTAGWRISSWRSARKRSARAA